MHDQSNGILYIFLIAHPDDESMFFLPTIRALILQKQQNYHNNLSSSNRHGHKFHILCLSNGNYDGLGSQRQDELHMAAKIISDQLEVKVLDDSHLKDGPNETWSEHYISNTLTEFLVDLLDFDLALSNHGSSLNTKKNGNANEGDFKKQKIVIVTFDQGGVSGHVNHIHTYLGATQFYTQITKLQRERQSQQEETLSQSFLLTQSRKDYQEICDSTLETKMKKIDHLASRAEIRLMVLQTISNPLVKYCCIDIWLVMLFSVFCTKLISFCSCSGSLFANKRNNSFHGANFDKKENIVDDDVTMFRMFEPTLTWSALAAHVSQFVWYRRLSIAFSRYSYENTLRLIQIDDDTIFETEGLAVGENDKIQNMCKDRKHQ